VLRTKTLFATAALAAFMLSAGASQAFTTTTVNGSDDLYNFNGVSYDGTAPSYIDVTGLSSITFSVSTGATVTVNAGNYNDADGIGSVSGENVAGAAGLSGITSPTAGFLTGAFVSNTLGATPASLDFTGVGGTSFTSLSPALQQAFFIGDGLTGDATGTTQVFYVPTGATKLYLGLADACGYNGGPSCYGDNLGSFTVTSTGVSPSSGGVPEPATWALMLTGFGGMGAVLRRRRTATTVAA
jgi:hypothetical protein